MKQLTSEEAVAFADQEKWLPWDDIKRATFQLNQECLCMPFDVFQKAVEVALGRGVWTHEFADSKSLIAELEGRIPMPDMLEIIGKLEEMIA